jgi:hypothetical protein
VAGVAPAGSVDVPRAAVFFYLARPEGAVQANSGGRGVGSVATVDEHGRFHFIFWAAGEAAFGRIAVPGFLFRGIGSVDIFFECADKDNEHRGRKPKLDHESIFPAIDLAHFRRSVWPGGFWNFVFGAAGSGAEIWIATGSARDLAAVFAATGTGDCTGSGVVAVRTERFVPRRGVCIAISGAVLDADVAGGLSEQPGSGKVAVAVRAESDGGSNRRIPLGVDGPRTAAKRTDAGIGGSGGGDPGEWLDVLPKDGRNGGGSGVRRVRR